MVRKISELILFLISPVFPGFLYFPLKRYLDGKIGIRCRLGRDFPVPFSTLHRRAGRAGGQDSGLQKRKRTR